jgi:hypothetical protein
MKDVAVEPTENDPAVMVRLATVVMVGVGTSVNVPPPSLLTIISGKTIAVAVPIVIVAALAVSNVSAVPDHVNVPPVRTKLPLIVISGTVLTPAAVKEIL